MLVESTHVNGWSCVNWNVNRPTSDRMNFKCHGILLKRWGLQITTNRFWVQQIWWNNNIIFRLCTGIYIRICTDTILKTTYKLSLFTIDTNLNLNSAELVSQELKLFPFCKSLCRHLIGVSGVVLRRRLCSIPARVYSYSGSGWGAGHRQDRGGWLHT